MTSLFLKNCFRSDLGKKYLNKILKAPLKKILSMTEEENVNFTTNIPFFIAKFPEKRGIFAGKIHCKRRCVDRCSDWIFGYHVQYNHARASVSDIYFETVFEFFFVDGSGHREILSYLASKIPSKFPDAKEEARGIFLSKNIIAAMKNPSLWGIITSIYSFSTEFFWQMYYCIVDLAENRREICEKWSKYVEMLIIPPTSTPESQEKSTKLLEFLEKYKPLMENWLDKLLASFFSICYLIYRYFILERIWDSSIEICDICIH
jgi:hypothetical protein